MFTDIVSSSQTFKIHYAHVPNYIYKEIIQGEIDAQDAKINFRNLKKTNMGTFKSSNIVAILKYIAPFLIKIILETNTRALQPIDVTISDFKTQLLSLLHNKTLFGNIENLDIIPKIYLVNTNLLVIFYLLSIQTRDIRKHIKMIKI